MTTIPKPIVDAYTRIMESSIFRLDGPEIDLPAALLELANAIAENETDEFTWSLGESSEASLDDLIPAAYWCLTEWHAGQLSTSYAALCAIGRIYSPGYASGPEPESAEESAYEMLTQWFEENAKHAF